MSTPDDKRPRRGYAGAARGSTPPLVERNGDVADRALAIDLNDEGGTAAVAQGGNDAFQFGHRSDRRSVGLKDHVTREQATVGRRGTRFHAFDQETAVRGRARGNADAGSLRSIRFGRRLLLVRRRRLLVLEAVESHGHRDLL